METVKPLDKNQIRMASSLLLMTTYYPDFPPLKAFTAMAFEGRKDFIGEIESGAVFADIQNCTTEQLRFLEEKLSEAPELLFSITTRPENITRIFVLPR